MGSRFPDSMVFQAIGPGPHLTAKQAMERSKDFLIGMEKISPWSRPFDVSGTTAKHGNMPIAEDWSDFEDVVMTAFGDYDDVKYHNEGAPDNWRLTVDSRSPYGFRTTFSDFVQKRKNPETVGISIKTAGNPPRLDFSLVAVDVPSFQPAERNGNWSKPETVHAIFNYLLDFCDPTFCVVYGSDQNLRNRVRVNGALVDGGRLGWLTYFKNPRLQMALSGDPRATEYRGGTLLTLGDNSVAALTDSKVDEEILEIRNKLRVAGVSDWTR
ncbi:hypothetical protein [Rhizobium sp. BR 315]|uniref:hypothetical protein n=1 Tax=Rhizobium sp. BR 315 TaxID=3040014 RepID=UPI003D333283